MGAGLHGGFGQTKGFRQNGLLPINLQFFASKVFEKGGFISEKSFSGHREFFLGKTVKRIENIMRQQGYKVHIEPSVHKESRAVRIIVDNPSKTKNVKVVQISPGSLRHGDTAYVKISTTNDGVYKVVSDERKYRSDGKEKAKIFFARRKRV